MEAVEEYNIGLANTIIHEKGRLQWKKMEPPKPPQLEAAMESNAGLSRTIISWRGREWRNQISAWVSAPPLALVTTIS